MVYFCADDYGVSLEGNDRIENCINNGVLNKISVLPNGEITDFKKKLEKATISLHINLIEGRPVSAPEDVDLLITKDGFFRYSFIGLFLKSFLPDKKKFENQIYKEIQSQVRLWKEKMGDNPVYLDSHQHTHMIPIVFKTLMKVIKDENLSVEYLRIPKEPVLSYIFTPSLYFDYSLTGFVKQTVLNMLYVVNYRKFKKSKIKTAYFMGVMFSGRVTEKAVNKLLPRYFKLADKKGQNIEIGLHPGYLETGESLICGNRDDFKKFYFSPWRKIEYETLINFKKEGFEHALY